VTLPETRQVRVEHAFARLAVSEAKVVPVLGADALLRSWRRTVEGERSIADYRWVALLDERSRLHDYGQAALAHNSFQFLAWLTPLLSAIDDRFLETTTPADGETAGWAGIDPTRWWFRRRPADAALTTMYAPIEQSQDADLTGLVHAYPPLPSDAKQTTSLPDQGSLAGAVLAGANLVAADLRRADLTGTDLTGANLACAQLDGATMKGALLDGADLRLASATGVDLTGASVARSRLDGATLTGSTLIEANFEGASLRAASLAETNARSARFVNADLTRCLTSQADLTGIKIAGSRGASRSMLRAAGNSDGGASD